MILVILLPAGMAEARLVITPITLHKDERAGSFARLEVFLRRGSRKERGRMGSVGSKILMKVLRKHLRRMTRYRFMSIDERAEHNEEESSLTCLWSGGGGGLTKFGCWMRALRGGCSDGLHSRLCGLGP
ncbi:hypothetical protein BGW80DRAFT_1322918 [Lactifluus volemus]|nr:hypothetical protein BGW80DRAFT_1322918 [Lactifluus volemus]